MVGQRLQALQRRRASAASAADKARILDLSATSGCVMCQQEAKATHRFFSWYVIETYQEMESLQAMKAARGFCPQHTQMFLARAIPGVVTYVYRVLIADALEILEDIAAADSSAAAEAGSRLAPTRECPVCERVAQSQERLVGLWQKTWNEPEVYQWLLREPRLFLPHFLEMAPRLSWEELKFAAKMVQDALLAGLRRPLPPQEEAGETMASVLWGLAPNRQGVHSCRLGASSDAGIFLGPGGAERKNDPCWSPTLSSLRAEIRRPGCLLCRAEAIAVSGYLTWLRREVPRSSQQQWTEAVWLCRDHGRRFWEQGAAMAAGRLMQAAASYWGQRLQGLLAELATRPQSSLLRRLGGAWHRGWQPAGPLDAKASWRLRLNRCHQEIRLAWRSPARTLAEHRERWLRIGECPACRARTTAVERQAALLVRGLEDPGTKTCYREGGGICFRHLPRALQLCTNQETSRFLLRDQCLRLRLLAWELEEYQRKQAWALRYEPRGPERDVWWRAAGQYSGIAT